MASSSPRLTVLGGSLAGKELAIEDAVDNVLIGSDPSCRFCLQLPGVSPIHARLWVDPQGITVYDTNAPQGLYVNDDRVTSQAALRNGDILWLGTPGNDDVVMIQCRIASRSTSAGAPVAPAEPPPLAEPAAADETSVLAPSGFEPLIEPEPELVAPDVPSQPEPQADQTVVLHDVTMDEGALTPPPQPQGDWGEPPIPPPSESSDSTAAIDSPFVEPPAEPTQAQWVPPPADVPGATPLPMVAPVFEEDIEEPSTARIEAQPTVHVPPAAPAPAVPMPRPVPAARAAAAPPRAAPAPAQPAKRPPARKGGGGGSGKMIGLAAVLLLVLGGGGAAAWYFLLGPGAQQTPPSAVPPPVTLAQAATPEPLPSATPLGADEPTPEPPVEETVTLVPPPITEPSVAPSASAAPTPAPSKPAPTAKPTPAARATPDPVQVRAEQVATFVTQGDAALGEKRYEAAVSLYTQALQLDPQNAAAAKGRAGAQAALVASRRSLVAGRSTLIGAKTDKKLSGFESEDVSLAKAPDYSGRLDFEASPKSPRAGDNYTVRVFLTNDGKKTFKVASFSATTSSNGERSGGPMAPAAREIPTQEKALLQELSGVWREGATAWSLEVSVQSAHGETIKNTLTWR